MTRAHAFATVLQALETSPAQNWLLRAGPEAKRLNEQAKRDK